MARQPIPQIPLNQIDSEREQKSITQLSSIQSNVQRSQVALGGPGLLQMSSGLTSPPSTANFQANERVKFKQVSSNIRSSRQVLHSHESHSCMRLNTSNE